MTLTRPASLRLTMKEPWGYFEDFEIGQKYRHARGATIGEVENCYISKQVLNTAQAHWNEHALLDGPLGPGRIVFGLITASLVFGLTSQDTASQAVREVSCTELRFLNPVHHGDTLYALTEIVGLDPNAGQRGEGLATFQHWGINQDSLVVFTGRRTLLVKRRPGATADPQDSPNGQATNA